MTLSTNKWKMALFSTAIVALSASVSYGQIPEGKKTAVKGTITSRNGDLITIKEKKSGDLVKINLFEDTKIERNTGKGLFARRPRMDVTAMLPGLTIDAEGVGNANGQLDAKKITFSPDDFVIAVAQEQQIVANQQATQSAQSTADRGVEAANAAQSSADQAQSSANQAGAAADRAQGSAVTATAIGMMDAEAIRTVNKRVSELDDYKVVAEAVLYFKNDSTVLDGAAKETLNGLASIAASTDNYMIEIAGYASKTGTRQLNQQLSEERAAAAADYLREAGNIPLRRILVPAGYGNTRAMALVADRKDQGQDRRVDVKVLVNKGESK